MPGGFETWACNRGNDEYIEHWGGKGFRTIYQHDRGEITYSKAFRRLAFKTHLLLKRDDHVRSKLSHTLEVSMIANEISKALGLNPDLTESIALGHDVGHPPYGHLGHEVLTSKLKTFGEEFDHGQFGCFLMRKEGRKKLEELGGKRFQKLKDLPLYESGVFKKEPYVITITKETLDGIKKHRGSDHRYSNLSKTLEGQVVRIADNLAYITQEIEEAKNLKLNIEEFKDFSEFKTEHRGKVTVMTKTELENYSLDIKAETKFFDIFSGTMTERINAMAERVIKYNTIERKNLKFAYSNILKKNIPVLNYDKSLDFLLDFIWNEFIMKRINGNPEVKKRKEKVQSKMDKLFDILVECPPQKRDKWFKEHFIDFDSDNIYQKKCSDKEKIYLVTANYIASMTERFIEKKFKHFGIK